MKLLLALLRKSPVLVGLSMVAGVIGGASNAGLLALVNTAIHTPVPWTDPVLVVRFVGLCLVIPVARSFSAYIMANLGQDTIMDLRASLSRKIMAAPLRRLEEVGSHRMLVALTQDVTTIVMAMQTIPLLFVHCSLVIASLVYLGWLSTEVLLVVMGFLVVGIITYQVPVLKAQSFQRRAREEADALYAHFRGITGGYKELKLHIPRQDAMIRDLDVTGLRLKGHTVTASTIFSAAAGWGQMVVFGMVGSIIFLAPSFADVGLKTMTGFALVLLYMMTPLEFILEAIPHMARAQVSFRKIEELGLSLDDERGPRIRPLGAPLPVSKPEWRSLELSGATHAYQPEGEETPFMLGPVDLTLWRGEIVFLVGGNGSGKTTLAKLLLGLYLPEAGELRFDGVPVNDANRDEYHHQFAVVFSDFYLFETLLGMEGPETDEQAARYLAQLHLTHKVRVQNGKLSTTALSQGQRKRLALLTAYLEDRPIYLFDEWAADQDPHFKEVFYHELLPELKARGKTVIVISHDDHYYHVADRIVKLDYGRIEYDGSPEAFRYRAEVRLAAATAEQV